MHRYNIILILYNGSITIISFLYDNNNSLLTLSRWILLLGDSIVVKRTERKVVVDNWMYLHNSKSCFASY